MFKNLYNKSVIITNKSNNDLTLMDFINENNYLIDVFMYANRNCIDKTIYSKENINNSIKEHNFTIPKQSNNEYLFGLEDNNYIGHILNYSLSSDESDNFKWYIHDITR